MCFLKTTKLFLSSFHLDTIQYQNTAYIYGASLFVKFLHFMHHILLICLQLFIASNMVIQVAFHKYITYDK